MKTFKEFLQEMSVASNVEITDGLITPEKMGEKIENMQPIGWFKTRDNPRGFSVHLLDKADIEWFKKEGEPTDGVFRIAGQNVLSLVKINFKTGKVQFFDNKKYEETDKIYWETPIKPILIKVTREESKKLNLNEVAIQFGKIAYPKFNNVVILAGGSGSGKSFVLSNLLSIEGRVLDVDKLKSLVTASTVFASKVKDETGLDVKNLNMKDPDEVSKLHEILSGLYNLDKKVFDTLFSSILVSPKDRKPNLIFDVTLKDVSKLDKITRNLENIGYSKENVHIVWVVNEFKIAQEQNKKRERVVSDEIMLVTHEGAALTFAKILEMGSKLKKYMDGDIYIAFNKIGVDSEMQKSANGGSYISKSNYVQVKKKGKPVAGIKELEKTVLDRIRKYIPKTLTWG